MAGKWTAAENALLAEIANSDMSLCSQMHRFPGRTWDAARTHASRIGISLRAAEAWTPEEVRILKKIWRGNESIKAAVARLLPHRGYLAARGEAQRLGISGCKARTGRTGYSWVARACEEILQDGQRLSIIQLAERTGASRNAVHKALVKLHGGKFRVGEWARFSTFGCNAGLWELGSGPDAPRPPRKSASRANREAKERRMIRAGQGNPFFSIMNQVAA
ncbi:hypothetical protein [Paraburkholderia kirstenboschensis]|uniref:Uncharacterized protein n=1 Tax=Paraburkholderia kirstenboschensis TaxID=1245436 RepID=A0ABZ0ERJ9_9BURK|nr:hypothetical protein [Paraburkholderia kirstenboschensis]WOD19819.1 hypothetical protein RW095_26790 [Paraburkholderia kirstenboschensis]